MSPNPTDQGRPDPTTGFKYGNFQALGIRNCIKRFGKFGKHLQFAPAPNPCTGRKLQKSSFSCFCQGGLILTQPILKNASLLRRKRLRWLRVNIEEKSNSLHVILSTAARKYKHCGSAIYHPEKTTQQKHLISRGHPWLSSLFVSRWNPSKEVHSEQQECLHRGWKNIFQAEKPAVHHHQATPFTFNTIVHCYHLLATIKLGVAIA